MRMSKEEDENAGLSGEFDVRRKEEREGKKKRERILVFFE
jgi:hypothetical protein